MRKRDHERIIKKLKKGTATEGEKNILFVEAVGDLERQGLIEAVKKAGLDIVNVLKAATRRGNIYSLR